MEWLGFGGEREDDGWPWNARYYNHFHNPLKPWSEAGLQTLVQHSSSVQWMQDPNQAPGGDWSWQAARRFYLQALTAPDARTREEAAADLFRTLGHIMHLVVDASVPEHTRDDAHPFGTIARDLLRRQKAGNYEYWVSDQHGGGSQEAAGQAEAAFKARFLSTAVGFDGNILQTPPPDGEPAARVPVARLIDTDRYTGEDPNVTLDGAIGLAEVANANFFSENTLHGQFPFPSRGALIPNPGVAPGSSRVRAYLSRPVGQGLPIGVALAECVTERSIGRWVVSSSPPYPCVDEAVWAETAAHMLPRAVGYARGVLDYFFRGSLRVLRVTPSPPGVIRIDIQNTSTEPMEGVLEVYGRYQKGTPDERRGLVSVLNDGAPLTIEPGQVAVLALDASPAEATAYHVLVFRGRLGLEEEAVVGQLFAVPHVQIIPESYDVDVASTCTVRSSPSSSFPFRDTITCTWQPFNHRIEGRLATNFGESQAANPIDPAIERIEVFWEGLTPGGAPVQLGGIDYPGGVWQREGAEPDPSTFVVADPSQRRSSRLKLRVTTRSGESFTSQVPTFGVLGQDAQKSVRFVWSGPIGWELTSRHTTVVQLILDSAFAALSIGGYPVPTAIFREGESIRALEKFGLSSWVGAHEVRDYYENVTSEGIEAKYAALELKTPTFPRAPALDFSGVVAPKALQAGALRFWNAFVATGEPVPYTIALRAREAGSD
ncbi:MAG: hypothetical protein HY657_08175 [Acidobacteria bacterium]|nr:hypothetical protein [Acidobacteriota bacterium]